MDDSTYAPQSPDLSSFLSSPSKQRQYHQNQQAYHPTSTSYAPRSPDIPSFDTQPHQQQNYLHHSLNQHHVPPQDFTFGVGSEFDQYDTSFMPAIPALPVTHNFHNPSQPHQPYYSQPIKPEPSYQTFDGAEDTYNPSSKMSRMPPTNHKNPNPNNIEIKTKFPVARIKRIMQADEEVGKVAQVTPVVVSKALELFMIALVEGAAEKAREKGGKRVTAQHLKMVVKADEQFDFLNEIVGKVPDGVEGAGGEGKAGKRKVKDEGSESEEEVKKTRKGKGRRKKNDD